MKFLLDTNIFIPLEPTNASDIEPQTSVAAAFSNKAIEAQQQLYLHPESEKDIERDKNDERRKLRRSLFKKYPAIPNPPPISDTIKNTLGEVTKDSNDWVDFSLIAAIEADTADYLVTEDQRLYKRCAKVGLAERVLRLQEALSLLNSLFDEIPKPPPAVQSLKAHQLNGNDPIFNSLRSDYQYFDRWLSKCKRDHRDAWVIQHRDNSYAGVAIVKREDPPEHNLSGRVLKICTLKVSNAHNGYKYGELLLKSIFNYAFTNGYNYLFITVFNKHSELITLLVDFGFEQSEEKTPIGEHILIKSNQFGPSNSSTDDPLSYHIRYGPFAFDNILASSFIVPILPVYHNILFPELEIIKPLFRSTSPSGNSIKKAYLSRSPTRKIKPGSLLFFYRTHDVKRITVMGVVEDILVSSSPQTIARFVGKRTVYTFDQIQEQCNSGRDVLSILFRQSYTIKAGASLALLKSNKIIKGAPQSITEISSEACRWLVALIKS